MADKNILCIVEGEVSEIAILNKLNKEFIQDNIVFMPLCTNIYHFYHAYIEEKQEFGEEIDLFLFLKTYDKEGILSSKRKKDFVSIYLFIDLEKQEPLSKKYDNCLPEMLQLFDNETENGKLYVSYPMVEALQHAMNPQETLSFGKIGNLKKYKQLTAQVQNHTFLIDKIDNVEKAELETTLIRHIKQAHYLLTNNFDYPLNYEHHTQNLFNQSEIYKNQNDKFFIKKEILILSSFSLFLLEYLGENLFNEWKVLA